MRIQIISGVILICIYGLTVVEGWDDKVLLERVQALTLYSGKYTTGRRTKPIKQMKCVGGEAGCHYEPDIIQCRNVGLDGTDPNWKCEANLPNSLKFGRLRVTCEGYDFREDPYILKGSCGLEYTLYYTDDRKKKKWFNNFFDEEEFKPLVDDEDNKSTLFGTLFGIFWFGILGYILYNMYLACMRTRRSDNRPPYRGSSPPEDGIGDEVGGVPYYNNGSSTTRRVYREENVPYPRFWTGALGGGLLGYLFGRRNNNNNHRTRRERKPSSSYGTSSSYKAYGFAKTDRR